MHAEELKHKPIGTVVGIFLTLALVGSIVFCIFVVNFLQFVLQVYWIQFILYGIVIIGAVLIVKNMLTEYIYLIEKDRVTFGRRIGKREKELLFIPFRDITSFGQYDSEKTTEKKKTCKFTFLKKSDWYVIETQTQRVVFSPTQEYIDCLKKAKQRKKKDANADT